MLERFTEEARRAVQAAQDQAQCFGHRITDFDHLILGVLQTGRDTAIIGGTVAVQELHRLVRSRPRDAGIPPGSAAKASLSVTVVATLKQAERSALRAGRNDVLLADLVLALLDEPRAVELMVAGGVEPRKLQISALNSLPVSASSMSMPLRSAGNEAITDLSLEVLRRLDAIDQHLGIGSGDG